jgi:hypothetical protein
MPLAARSQREGLAYTWIRPSVVPFYLNRNGQAITLTRELLDEGVKRA